MAVGGVVSALPAVLGATTDLDAPTPAGRVMNAVRPRLKSCSIAGTEAREAQTAVTAIIACLALRWRTPRSFACDGAASAGKGRSSARWDDTSWVDGPVP